MAKQFELTSPVWQNASEQIPAGTTVTFDNDEPSGIFIGRVRELNAAGDALEIPSGKNAKKELNAQTREAAPVPAPPKK